MKCICPNDLTRLVTVEKLKTSATVDGSGNIDESNDSNWETYTTAWAKIATVGSREYIRSEQLAEDASHQFTIRYSTTASGIKTGMRLSMDSRKFNIVGAPMNVDEVNQWILIQTKETVTV